MVRPLTSTLLKIAKASVRTVYLDQNAWITFLKEREGVTQLKEVKESLDGARRAVDDGRAVFPLSLVHLLETGKRRDKASRDKLAELMFELSKGWCVIPYTKMMTREISNLACQWAGLPISKFQAFGLGINHIFGQGKGEVVFDAEAVKSLTSERAAKLSEIKADLDKKVNDPSVVLWALKNQNMANEAKRMAKYDMQYVSILEQTRQIEFLTTDPELRRKRSMTFYFGQGILPRLAQFCLDAGLSRPQVEKKVEESDIEEILKELPSAYTTWLLNFRRDVQKERPVKQNDMRDIFALSIAIPYCNIVVTENEWTSIAKQGKIDTMFHTEIFNSVANLTAVL